MYLKHYNLQQLPFRNSPDPRFFLETAKHNEALANLVYAVEQRRGFVLLTGEIGSGKTLVTHLLLQHVEDHALVALIRNTHLNSSQLIRLICDEFSVPVGHNADKASMLLSLNQFLIHQLSEDKLVVVIIDEAQNLSDKVLEELRMLSNLETSSEKLLQIVLVGQPELRQKISQPHLEQLRQRIALNYHLEPLTAEEVATYIHHRLEIAGAQHTALFTPEAIEKIYRFSKGTPRIVNGVCDNSLLYGFTAGVTTIDADLVDRVLRQSMQLSPRQKIGPMRTPTYSRPEPGPRPPAQAPTFGLRGNDPAKPPSTAAGVLGATRPPAERQPPSGEDHASPLASAAATAAPAVSADAATTTQAEVYTERQPPVQLGNGHAATPLTDGAALTSTFPDDIETVAPRFATAAGLDAPPDATDLPMADRLSQAAASAETQEEPTPSNSSAPEAPPVPTTSVVLCVPAEALFGLPQI